MDKLIRLAVEDLIKRYQPHTIILYGSRARGEATQASDIDIACFVDSGTETKEARVFHGVYLDAWVYPSEKMTLVSDDALRFGDGICLLDQRGLGGQYLAAIQERIEAGPEILDETDRSHTFEWISKMLSRIELDDLEGKYRRHWLQFELLEIYFQLRGLWFFGPKKSLRYLQENDAVAYQLFYDVYDDPTDVDRLKLLVQCVVGKS
ncbi:nucleotidyltransferase domain-containing protein [Marinomonas spartinae]|uniref:nucleotidyltransferase domain-containing protein n=1 Tax=Marinomonas spartinae TaxID=1792290 RepID=UPI0018F25E4F|nr:nucleotidyltransferase domain-containing protein [Marinomonas spartinae]MBJ7555194.1 nucleotidyltransferase domain-containing protein [Marinomonas spartinae]